MMRERSTERTFYLGDACRAGDLVQLSPRQSRHLVRVLRFREGDSIAVRAAGGGYAATVCRAEPRAAEVRVGERIDGGPAVDVPVALAFAPPRGNRSDRIVEKATELGVARLQPVECERVQSFRVEAAQRRSERWRRLCRW